jgi:hypothetical protein
VKKTRSRKKAEAMGIATPAEQGSAPQADLDVSAPLKRGRCKKSAESGTQDGETTARQIDTESTIPPPKPKRVGSPTPKRYAVGESEEPHHGESTHGSGSPPMSHAPAATEMN